MKDDGEEMEYVFLAVDKIWKIISVYHAQFDMGDL